MIQTLAMQIATQFTAFWIGFFTIVGVTWFMRQLIFK